MEIPEFNSSNPAFVQAYKRVAQAEQKPIKRIDKRVEDATTKLELIKDFKQRVSSVKTSLEGMRTVNDFRELVGKSSDPAILDALNVDKTLADVGKYDFEILNLANTDSIMTYGFEDPDKSEVGVGYVTLETPEGETRDVYINSENNTLKGVASAINSAKMGVKAHVVHDGTDAEAPWRLVISGEGTGWKEDFEWPTFYLLDGDLEFDTERSRDAKSAIIRFNGHPIMVDENQISDLLPGVQIDLKKARPGETIFFEVSPDIKSMAEKVQSFVASVNEVLQFIQDQNKLDSKSYNDPTKALGGDVSIQALESRFRTLIQKTLNPLQGSQITRMQDIGITFKRDGLIQLDEEKLDTALHTDFDGVATMVSGTNRANGFANEMIRLVDGIVRFGDGMLTSREQNLNNQLTRLERDKERVEEQVTRKLRQSKEEFARAEAAMAQMNQFAQSLGGGSLIPGA